MPSSSKVPAKPKITSTQKLEEQREYARLNREKQLKANREKKEKVATAKERKKVRTQQVKEANRKRNEELQQEAQRRRQEKQQLKDEANTQGKMKLVAASASASEDEETAPVEDLRLFFGGASAGVSAQAEITLMIDGASTVFKSYMYSNGPWASDNHARYYQKYATGKASGDAEVKVLSDIANQLEKKWDYTGPMPFVGTMTLHTTKGPCNSCRKVIKQFKREHPNVRITIIYGGGGAVEPNTDTPSWVNGYEDAVWGTRYWKKEL